jgi:hypothetical protein
MRIQCRHTSIWRVITICVGGKFFNLIIEILTISINIYFNRSIGAGENTLLLGNLFTSNHFDFTIIGTVTYLAIIISSCSISQAAILPWM